MAPMGQPTFRPRPVNPVLMAVALVFAALGGAGIGLVDGNSAAHAQAMAGGATR